MRLLLVSLGLCVCPRMLELCKQQNVVDDYGSMLDYYRNINSVSQIPCFHGDLIETTLAGVF